MVHLKSGQFLCISLFSSRSELQLVELTATANGPHDGHMHNKLDYYNILHDFEMNRSLLLFKGSFSQLREQIASTSYQKMNPTGTCSELAPCWRSDCAKSKL